MPNITTSKINSSRQQIGKTSETTESESLRIEIRASEGGVDAVAFAAQLSNTVQAILQRKGAPCSVVSGKTILITTSQASQAHIEALVGTHRIQRVPANKTTTRRHTSTATLALLTEKEDAPPTLIDSEIRMDFYRGHGKGGQHRNKRSTAVRVTHLPTGITVAIERGRSQAQNIDLARQELLTRLSARKTNSASATENAARTAQLAGTKPGTSRWT